MILILLGAACSIFLPYTINLLHAQYLWQNRKINPQDANLLVVNTRAQSVIGILFLIQVSVAIGLLYANLGILGMILFVIFIAVGVSLRRLTGNILIGGKYAKDKYEDIIVREIDVIISNERQLELYEYSIEMLYMDMYVMRRVFGVKGVWGNSKKAIMLEANQRLNEARNNTNCERDLEKKRTADPLHTTEDPKLKLLEKYESGWMAHLNDPAWKRSAEEQLDRISDFRRKILLGETIKNEELDRVNYPPNKQV